jgi:hypothetical protein
MSMTQAATAKIAADAPSIPAPRGMNSGLRRKLLNPPQKNVAK